MTFVGITAETDRDLVDATIAKWYFEFPTIVEEGAALWAEYGISSHPTTIYIAADGTEQRVTGGQRPAAVKANIEALLP